MADGQEQDHRRQATKLVAKGAFDKAIKEYEKVLAEDPKDVRVLHKIGELHQKKNDNAAGRRVPSARWPTPTASRASSSRRWPLYKQMLKLAPDDVRGEQRLAELHQQLGILSDAMGQLPAGRRRYEKAGDQAKLLDDLRRMVELEPENVASA